MLSSKNKNMNLPDGKKTIKQIATKLIKPPIVLYIVELYAQSFCNQSRKKIHDTVHNWMWVSFKSLKFLSFVVYIYNVIRPYCYLYLKQLHTLDTIQSLKYVINSECIVAAASKTIVQIRICFYFIVQIESVFISFRQNEWVVILFFFLHLMWIFFSIRWKI